ncbi:putative U1 small nuclear ribonucleoprotein Usp102p [[Candida] railenensis]|uniref:U1 small nuclear ribonucleoprotein Usp102p n=1 Tax=[Candida] railenensis TaxID=45579 RepID=A0A9P0QLE0_9ASCO|nr:putative U1 small nuclear ribonucleoprotein Usp102p [[Candida] railenensis]
MSQPTSQAAPIETLYLRNLNEKISINKLKAKLQSLFSTYGAITQITAHKNLKMKGQAFITYESTENAKNALNKLQNFIIFEKPVHIQFSKSNSDNLYKLKAEEGQETDEIVEIKQRKEKKIEREQLKKKRTNIEVDKTNIEGTSPYTKSSTPATFEPETKRVKIEDWKSLPPNSVLLIQNLPSTTTKESLDSVFESTKGFINIRFVKIRNLAFIEFDNEALSTEVLRTFDSDLLSEKFSPETILTYAKK